MPNHRASTSLAKVDYRHLPIRAATEDSLPTYRRLVETVETKRRSRAMTWQFAEILRTSLIASPS